MGEHISFPTDGTIHLWVNGHHRPNLTLSFFEKEKGEKKEGRRLIAGCPGGLLTMSEELTAGQEEFIP